MWLCGLDHHLIASNGGLAKVLKRTDILPGLTFFCHAADTFKSSSELSGRGQSRTVLGGGGNTHSVLNLNEGVVDGNDVDVVVLDGVAEDDATNAAETVDANLDGSHCY